MSKEIPEDSWDVLSEILTPQRRQRLTTAVGKRTQQVRLILQDVHNPHNISACLRSAEAFGIQNIDIVTLNEPFRASTSARGVADWLTIHKWKTIQECAESVKEQGFLIAAGMPAPESVSLHDLTLDKPLAILFGNEHAGVSPDWQKFVDIYFTIPMMGLVESMNISVCAAITMHHLIYKLQITKHPAQFINLDMQKKLLGLWARKALTAPDQIYENLKNK
jgi:tRNA (guanosine-2'-O-)-methyltransferase